MTRQHFAAMRRDPLYKRAVAFIMACRAEGVPLSAFTTNDWTCNTRPSVYVETPYPRHRYKRYERLDRMTIRYAVQWYALNAPILPIKR